MAAELHMELLGIAEELEAGSGFWRSCSGCHESNEGHPTGPYSKVFRCHLGNGCRECGGLGAVWDDTDYDAMADFMADGMAPQAHAIGVNEGLVLAIKGHMEGWASATFAWQDDADAAVAERNRAAAIEAHAAECLRRIRDTLAYGVPGTPGACNKLVTGD